MVNSMRKYFYILKMQVMSNIQYIMDAVLGFTSYAIIMFIYLNLWNYLYSDPSELINGYTMKQMIWYVAMTEILWMSLGGKGLCNKIVREVKSGDIVYKVNKPFSYVGFCIFNHLGDFVIKFMVYVILGFTLGYLFLGGFPNISLISMIIVLISSVLATLISMLLIISIGLLSFFMEDSIPFYWIYSKFILVIGTLFPIEFFPSIVRPIIKFSPIYVVSYGPAKLFVDFNYSYAVNIIVSQIIYVAIGILLCTFIYRRGVKKINVNGG